MSHIYVHVRTDIEYRLLVDLLFLCEHCDALFCGVNNMPNSHEIVLYVNPYNSYRIVTSIVFQGDLANEYAEVCTLVCRYEYEPYEMVWPADSTLVSSTANSAALDRQDVGANM